MDTSPPLANILNVSYTKDEALQGSGAVRQLLDTIKQSKISYLDHIVSALQYLIPKIIEKHNK